MLIVLGLWCMFSAGCLGPEAIKRTRLKYNEAYRSTNDEQILLNIVRLRYADSPVFVDLPSITGQFEASARGNDTGGIGGQIPGSTQLGMGEIFLRDAPTLSYHPRDGHEMGRALMTPLTAELLRLMSPGANTEQFLRMAVNDVNDVPNAPLATSLAPKVPDENSRFLHGVKMLVALQQMGAAELSIATYDADAFDPIPLHNVRGEDALNAVKDGYVFRTGGGQATLKKREKTVVLKVRADALDSFEMQEMVAAFNLRPGQPLYKIRSEASEEETPGDLPDAIEAEGGTIVLNMRSTLQVMTFLAKGVCVPEEHVRSGVVPTTPGPDGRPFPWTDVTRGLFHVNSYTHRPRGADTVVPYKGYWFAIEADDVESRSVLALLEILLALQDSEREQLGPLLTLPIQ